MKMSIRFALAAAGAAGALAFAAPPTLQQQNESLLHQLQQEHGMSDAQMQKIRAIFARSGFIGQGNPAISKHPLTPAQCRAVRNSLPAPADTKAFERICGGPDMAPLYDPSKESAENAHACIDQYEFPDIPCEYPVVWVRAREAAEICEAMGKRLCDAHEWEGACQGRLAPPDYRFDLARGVPANVAVERMREAHNRADAADKRWSYGPEYRRGICATGSQKTPGCLGGGWIGLRLEHLPGRLVPRLPQPAGCLRPERQRRRAHEPAAGPVADGQPRQPRTRRHRDEGQLVHLRPLPCARGLVPLAGAVLAWHARDGPGQPRELPPRVPLLQDAALAPPQRRRSAGCFRTLQFGGAR